MTAAEPHRPDAATAPSPWLRSRTRRVLDLGLTACLLVVTAPVLAVLAVAVRVVLGRPVLFRHQRAGRHGRPFTLVKLRTMTDARDADGALRPEPERLTRFGGLLRGASLDELPELFQVLTGRLSLVGPRPLLVEYNDRYDAEQAERLLVRPGITGLAQVSGRNTLDWGERFALDVEYVRTATPRTDAAILLRTVTKVLRRSDVTAEGQETPDKFRGS